MGDLAVDDLDLTTIYDYDTAETRRRIEALTAENKRLYEALSTLRSLVKEGGVPRYTVTPGAGLNTVIEADVDPVIKAYRRNHTC